MDKHYFDNIMGVLPKQIKDIIDGHSLFDETEEIRLRVQRKTELIIFNGQKFIDFISSKEDILTILKKGADHSLYAHEDEIREGYLTMAGGHRIGFTGRVLHNSGKIISMQDFNSLNIRVARQISGSADNTLPYMFFRANCHPR